jgi:large subunit ribosomal protein L15
MDLSTLKSTPGARKPGKRLGRGPSSGSGKTSGHGHKGQKARSGYSARRGFEGGQMPLTRRVPKRGFNHQKRYPFAIVNVDVLERVFDEGATVTPETIVAAGLADLTRGGVKILARGEIAKKLQVKVNAISPAARAKIEAAGGAVEIIALPETAAPAPAEPREEQ